MVGCLGKTSKRVPVRNIRKLFSRRRLSWPKHFVRAYLCPSLPLHSIFNCLAWWEATVQLPMHSSHTMLSSWFQQHHVRPQYPIMFTLKNWCPHCLAVWSMDVSPILYLFVTWLKLMTLSLQSSEHLANQAVCCCSAQVDIEVLDVFSFSMVHCVFNLEHYTSPVVSSLCIFISGVVHSGSYLFFTTWLLFCQLSWELGVW